MVRKVLENIMMNARFLGVIAGAAVIPFASAQQIPALETGNPTMNVARYENQIEIVDAANGTAVLKRGYNMFASMGPGIQITVDTQTQPTGVDLIYHVTNSGSEPARMGRFVLGTLNLGPNVTYHDFRHIGEPVAADVNNFPFQSFTYPQGIYSPVWVLQNADYAVGISLQYPVMDYKHDARVMLGTTPGDADPVRYGPRGWFVEYRFANLGDEGPTTTLRYQSYLQPGEERTYVVSIRVEKRVNEWIRTLTPYRDYFRSMYGGVAYRRDDRPVRAILMSADHMINPDNPYGWAVVNSQRPDRHTFRPKLDLMKADRRWSRTMVWAPTGMYATHRELNFPYQFASRWVDDPQLASALDPTYGFPSLRDAGLTLGLWWGRSVQVARTWNPDTMEDFDPLNPDHRDRAFREMDIAMQAGATDIGLDTFSCGITPIWKLYPWLRTLRERYPSAKFIVEPVTCDILHTQAGMFVLGWGSALPPDATIDYSTIQNPYYLADFLNPGHESWGAASFHLHRARGFTITPEHLQSVTERLASLGFIPLMYDQVPSPENVRAAQSWNTSVPADLLRGSGWNTNFNSGMVVRGADGRMQIVESASAPRKDGDKSFPVLIDDTADEPDVIDDAGPAVGAAGPASASSTVKGGSRMGSAANASKSAGGVKAAAKGGGSKPSAATNRRNSYRPRSGANSSAQALAQAGLLGKSSRVLTRKDVQGAISRIATSPTSPK